MAGDLVLINETIVSTSTATVSLTGIDSTFDIYKVVYNNLTTDTDNKQVRLRFTVSGTADSSSNYDYALKISEVQTLSQMFQIQIVQSLDITQLELQQVKLVMVFYIYLILAIQV